MDEGHPKISASTDGAKTHQIVTPPVLEEIKADMTISLVFSIMIKENPEEELPEIGDFCPCLLGQLPYGAEGHAGTESCGDVFG